MSYYSESPHKDPVDSVLPQQNRRDEHIDGLHLRSAGPYAKTIASMCARNPILRYGESKWRNSDSDYGALTVLEFHERDPISRIDLKGSQMLKSYLLSTSQKHRQRRLFMLEGVARNFVQVLGCHFNMDPEFFARQKRTQLWEVAHKGGKTPSLPSLKNPKRSFMIRYLELRYFPLVPGENSHKSSESFMPQIDDFYLQDVVGKRNINVSRKRRPVNSQKDIQGEFDNVGKVSRCASYWGQAGEDGGWDAVLLLDPPLDEIVKTDRNGYAVESKPLQHVPFQGGYLDFIQYPEGPSARAMFLKKHGPPRTSMLEDICFYWMNHADLVPIGSDPSISTIFLKKIVASHWMHYAEYTANSAHSSIYHMSRREAFEKYTINTTEKWWTDLHDTYRVCMLACEDVATILESLRIPIGQPKREFDLQNYLDSSEDFVMIYQKLLWRKDQLELLITSATGLNAIAGNKVAEVKNAEDAKRSHDEQAKSLEEAKKASILTFLALIFVPLAYTSSLFSMAGDWQPGGANFRYYWAISLPLAVVVAVTFYVISIGLRKSPGENSDSMRKENRTGRVDRERHLP
ncbi:hypothetical protein OIDMADRAFT_31495 [Oidiodendron maius Zn]|uniref:Uncharacterized protein n=1 Tax=Oidiodendron maius (strain Zn) TaxID=913774 RepID=A0A0C3CIC9_OIDMZ|nr:hypothetical protein OIDMADRAFT_31495 [Oidiodendron maius Zn]